jgi:hypothetical protein
MLGCDLDRRPTVVRDAVAPALQEHLVSLAEPDRWRRALDGIPHSWWHTWEGSDALARSHGLPAFLYCCTDEGTGHRAVLPYAERTWGRHTDLFSPAGFAGFAATGPLPGLRRAWRRHVVARGHVCGYFALHPLLCDPGHHGATVSTNELFILPLVGEPAAWLARCRRDVRRIIRRHERNGLGYVCDRVALGGFLRAHYAAFLKAAGARPETIWSEPTLQALCDDPAVLIAGIADERGICAVSVFGMGNAGGEYLANISVRGGRTWTAALVWWGMRQLRDRGAAWLNLGGGVARDDTLAEAKRGYGPDRHPLLGARELYRPTAYRRLCARAGRPDDPGAPGFFPGYRQPAASPVAP